MNCGIGKKRVPQRESGIAATCNIVLENSHVLLVVILTKGELFLS